MFRLRGGNRGGGSVFKLGGEVAGGFDAVTAFAKNLQIASQKLAPVKGRALCEAGGMMLVALRNYTVELQSLSSAASDANAPHAQAQLRSCLSCPTDLPASHSGSIVEPQRQSRKATSFVPTAALTSIGTQLAPL